MLEELKFLFGDTKVNKNNAKNMTELECLLYFSQKSLRNKKFHASHLNGSDEQGGWNLIKSRGAESEGELK